MIEKNIVDRVPKHAGRVRLIPVSGQADLFTMTRADEPTVEGTPLDKSTLDSITQSRLTGRYYTPTVTRATVSSATSTSNPIPQSGWINISDTGAQSGNYIVTASGSRSNVFSPDKAFDGDSTSSWQVADEITGETWIAVNFGTPIIITKMRVYWTSQDGEDFIIRLQGSNNGSNWVDVASRSGSLTAAIEWAFTNSTPYSQYRLLFRQGTVNPMRLYEWSVIGWSTATYHNTFKLESGVPTKWDIGQRLTIQTPSGINTVAVTENFLNGVRVNTILLPSRKYELVYNGASFDTKEL